jgi:hypothetical protein
MPEREHSGSKSFSVATAMLVVEFALLSYLIALGFHVIRSAFVHKSGRYGVNQQSAEDETRFEGEMKEEKGVDKAVTALSNAGSPFVCNKSA